MISSFINFGKFFLTGSFDRNLEDKLKESDFKVERFITTQFKQNYHEFKDCAKIQQARGIETTPSASAASFAKTVHSQVELIYPDMKYYNAIYDQFCTHAFNGMLATGGAALVSGAIAVFKTRTIAAILFTSAAVLSAGSLYFYKLTVKAMDFLDKTCNPCNKNERMEKSVFEYAKKVENTRHKLFLPYRVGNNWEKIALVDDDKAASPSEIEISTLFRILERSRDIVKSSNNSPCSLRDVLGKDYNVATDALTPEMRAINAYLEELTGSKWIQKTIPALMNVIPDKLQNNKPAYILGLQRILNEHSTMQCLEKLSNWEAKIVVGHLSTYLEACSIGSNKVTLPTEEKLAEFTKPIKESVRVAMLKIVGQDLLKEISPENSFWAQAGFKPHTLEWE